MSIYHMWFLHQVRMSFWSRYFCAHLYTNSKTWPGMVGLLEFGASHVISPLLREPVNCLHQLSTVIELRWLVACIRKNCNASETSSARNTSTYTCILTAYRFNDRAHSLLVKRQEYATQPPEQYHSFTASTRSLIASISLARAVSRVISLRVAAHNTIYSIASHAIWQHALSTQFFGVSYQSWSSIWRRISILALLVYHISAQHHHNRVMISLADWITPGESIDAHSCNVAYLFRGP